MINIAIAEDNSFLLQNLLDKLKGYPFNIYLTACNGRDLMEKLDNHVQLVLMDIQMPEMDGIEATAAVKQKYPQIKVLILTVFDDDKMILNAITNGADGYVLKDEPAVKIAGWITEIMEGGAPMSPSIAAKTLQLLRNPSVISSEGSAKNLTDREIDILKQLKFGKSYDQIAENLFISPNTVRKHIENIYRKLQVNNKTQAVQEGLKHRII